jgi:hypothetical protein
MKRFGGDPPYPSGIFPFHHTINTVFHLRRDCRPATEYRAARRSGLFHLGRGR